MRARTISSPSCGSKWMSEAPSATALLRSELTRSVAVAVPSGSAHVLEARELVVGALVPDLDVDAVGPLDRALERGGVGHGELDVDAQGEPEVVGGRDVRRVLDGDQEHVLGEKPDRQHLCAPRELLGEEAGRRRLDLDAGEVHELKAVLVRKRLGEGLRRDRPALDEDLADPAARLLLLGSECLLQLLAAEAAAVDEQLAEQQARLRGRHRGHGGSGDLRSLHEALIGRGRGSHEQLSCGPARVRARAGP